MKKEKLWKVRYQSSGMKLPPSAFCICTVIIALGKNRGYGNFWKFIGNFYVKDQVKNLPYDQPCYRISL